MPYPSCFGHFKSGDRPSDPAGACRKCQPFRKCREETLILYRKDHGIGADEPICMGQCGAIATEACRKCRSWGKCSQLTREKEKAIRLEREQVEEEHKQTEENVLVERLKKKVQDQWGGSDAE